MPCLILASISGIGLVMCFLTKQLDMEIEDLGA